MMSLNVMRDLFVECHNVYINAYGYQKQLSQDCLDHEIYY